MAENEKVPGLSIAALVLGIVSVVTLCIWFISIPCAILALIFGILGVKKPKKGFALTGIITSSISLALIGIVFTCVFFAGMIDGMSSSNKSKSSSRSSYSYNSRIY